MLILKCGIFPRILIVFVACQATPATEPHIAPILGNQGTYNRAYVWLQAQNHT